MDREIRIANGNFGLNGVFVLNPIFPVGNAPRTSPTAGFYSWVFLSFIKPAALPSVVVQAELHTRALPGPPFMLYFTDRAYKTLP